MSQYVRAAVITAFDEPLEIVDAKVPDVEPGGMLASVEAATLCGTDIHRWHGPASRDSLPFIPGHETCGRIVEMRGERVDMLGAPLAVGDRVTWTYAGCGDCFWCQVSRQPSLCSGVRPWGASRVDTYPYLLGGLAELQYVPPGCGVVRVPAVVSSESAAASACAYRTIMNAFERLGPIEPHETVAIQGSGPLGLFAAIVAKARGAFRVLMIGAPAGRLQIAEQVGVDDCLNIDVVGHADDRLAWVRDRTGGRGADVVMQCATLDAVGEGLTLTRRGGRYVSVGVGGTPTIGPGELWRSVTIIPTVMAEPRHWLQAMQFLESRWTSIGFDALISRSYRLDEATDAMRAMAAFEVVKPVIRPNG